MHSPFKYVALTLLSIGMSSKSGATPIAEVIESIAKGNDQSGQQHPMHEKRSGSHHNSHNSNSGNSYWSAAPSTPRVSYSDAHGSAHQSGSGGSLPSHHGDLGYSEGGHCVSCTRTAPSDWSGWPQRSGGLDSDAPASSLRVGTGSAPQTTNPRSAPSVAKPESKGKGKKTHDYSSEEEVTSKPGPSKKPKF